MAHDPELNAAPSKFSAEVERLARKVSQIYAQTPPNDRLLIGIAGIPGAGKSTIAQLVAEHLNLLHAQESQDNSNVFAIHLPMDGFHYSRAHLAKMPDAETAIHRRGAAFTYDADGFHRFIQRLRAPIADDDAVVVVPIYGPSFDHAVKDPVVDGIAIHPTASRVILVEGNYLALDRQPWSWAAGLMDELWFVEVDRDTARDRLIRRHVASGICTEPEIARHRVESTDFLNADDILQNMLPVQEYINI